MNAAYNVDCRRIDIANKYIRFGYGELNCAKEVREIGGVMRFIPQLLALMALAKAAGTDDGKKPNTLQPAKRNKGLEWRNLAIGAAIQTAEVSTLGQPLEVLKTKMAAHRTFTLRDAVRHTWSEGGARPFYRGLVPWAWIEASTKGGVLLFAQGEAERGLRTLAVLPEPAVGVLAGMAGGLAQAYTTMGFCTFMKTVEITRQRAGAKAPGTLATAAHVLRTEGWTGMNRGVSAVALRQMTNWGSRFGVARITEAVFRGDDKGRKLTTGERLGASVIGGAVSCWNQPFEVLRVEMQRQATNADGNKKRISMAEAARRVHADGGLAAFYRGATPRIMLSVYLTVCMVFGGDQVKAHFARKASTAA